jgi:oligopeptide transport system substrate-binding protein
MRIACRLALVAWGLFLALPVAAETVLYRGAYGDPESLEPNRSGVSSEQTMMRDLFEGLTSYAADGGIVAGAAESWQPDAAGRAWIFKLRPGLRWSDGQPLTAEDWVYAWRRMFTPATALPRASRLYALRNARAVHTGQRPATALGARAIDARTLQIELEYPLPWLPTLLAAQEGTPLPRHALEKHGAQWTRPGNHVSNGAFRLAERKPRGNIRLERNPHFHDASNVRLDAVIYVPSDDTLSLVNRFRAGELQINGWPGFATRQQTALKRELGPAVRVLPQFSVRFLRFNMRRTPFDDPRVRRALALIVDRELLVSKVIPGGETASYRSVPRGLPDDHRAPTVDLATGSQAGRLAAARLLLGAAKFRTQRPGPVRIRVPSGNGEELCLAVAAMWSAAGVPTVVVKSEIKSLIADLRRGDFDVALTGSADTPAVEAYLERFLAGSTYNTGFYANPAFDRALRQAQNEPDDQRRQAAVARAEIVLNRDYAIVPLIQEVARNLVAARVTGWVDNPNDIHLSRYLALKQSGR